MTTALMRLRWPAPRGPCEDAAIGFAWMVKRIGFERASLAIE
jgi:hypothetical protein